MPEFRKKMPDIPVQRALVKYRNGIETLIIESTFDGEGDSFGWIIPVPNEPHKFEKISPGILKTLSLQLQPVIVQEKPLDLEGTIFIIFTVALIALACFCIILWGLRGIFPAIGIIVLFFLTIPYFISYRAGPESTTSVNPFVEIKGREIVGNYEIFVLKATDSFDLNTWLEKNGFSKFSANATRIIDDYISYGWCFAVAKLVAKENGLSTPHPILLEFKSRTAVYPMRLTALPGSTLYLELFVVAEKEAVPVNYRIKKEYCDFFDSDHGYPSSGPEMVFKVRGAWRSSGEVAHSDAQKIMWNGCVVTKFADKVSSEQMNKDMVFAFKDTTPDWGSCLFVPASDHEFQVAFSRATIVFIIGLLLLTIYFRMIVAQRNMLLFRKLFSVLFILCLAVFAMEFTVECIFSAMEPDEEKIQVVSFKRDDWRYSLDGCIADAFSDPEMQCDETLIEALKEYGCYNPFTGEPIIIEDSPGNILCERDEYDIDIKVFLQNGSFVTM